MSEVGASEAGSPIFPGIWYPVPGAPASCGEAVAATPAQSVTSWQWMACPAGTVGCRKLVVDWSLGPGRTIGFYGTEPARLVGAAAYIAYQRLFPKGASYSASMTVVQPVDAAPVFGIGQALGTATDCGIVVSAGEYGIGLYALPNQMTTYTFAWAPWTSLQSWSSTSVPAGALMSSYAQALAMGPAQLFVEVKAPDSVDLIDLTSQKAIVPSSPVRLQGESPRIVPDGALVTDYAAFSLDLLHADGSFSSLILPTAPHLVTAFAIDRSSANAIVWVESDGHGPYMNSEIWTSPYSGSSALIQRRAVAKIGNDTLGLGGAGMVVNAGVALNITGNTTALLTRLVDGQGWSITAEQGDGFVQPLWVDANDVWIVTANAALQNFAAYASGVMRLSRSALGAPNVGPGL